MNEESYNQYMRKAVAVLLIVLAVCLVARICLMGLTIAENKAEKEHESQSDPLGSDTGNPDGASEAPDSSEVRNDSQTGFDSDTTDVPSSGTVLKPTVDAGQEYIDKIVFLGDSTSWGLASYGKVPKSQVWSGLTDGGLHTLSLYSTINTAKIACYDENDGYEMMTIAEALALKKPEYLVITLGINGGVGGYYEPRQFKASFKKIIDAVKENSPATKVILQNILPVTSKVNETYSTINQEKVDKANTWVKEIAETNGLKYLDSAEVLKGDDGCLPDSYTNGDGLHLNGQALGVLIDYIRTHAYEYQ